MRAFPAGRAHTGATALCFGPAGWSAGLALLIAACSGCDVTRFEADAEGMVRDVSTGLEWTRRDAAHALAWEAAEAHCQSLGLGGSRDWRLPEIDELSAVYDEAVEAPCGSGPACQLDPALELRGPFVWSATASQPTRRFYIDFRFGTRLAPITRPGLTRRVLCVRGDAASQDQK